MGSDDLIEKKIKREEIFNGRVIHLVVDDIELADGSASKREVILHRGGVGVLAITDDEKVILVKQYRYSVGEVSLELPAGGIEEGEDPSSAAKRELEEETGYIASEVEIFEEFYPTPGYSSEVSYIYVATGLKKGVPHQDEGENVYTVEIPFSEAYEMALNGKIKDGRTIIALLKAKLLYN